ncbi:MAG: exodeoxyribonuclease VII large subunit [Endomicrobia bacterium]|nr:exodeoxyribonuclease VII large subunit [Endomicrobiia bacterium]
MSKDLELDFGNHKENDGRLIYTVTQLNNEIKAILEDSYPGIWLSGEISNFKLYNSGHMYFNIKDENAQINAVMFQGANTSLTFAPENGMRVTVYGRVSAYPKRGEYQIVLNHMEQSGKGDLFAAFEKLKKKLEKEGLFDPSVKKDIPKFINKIGIVTSKDGAALHDIVKVLEELEAGADVLVYPVRVQGAQAEKEIPRAIRYFNENHKELDVLLVGRGGGSAEDLWAFNTEPVARAIFESKIPVISCVGHEIDFTIADFVAAKRAPTPSAAAEMAVRGKSELRRKVAAAKEALINEINFIVNNCTERVEILASSRALQKPHLIYEDKTADIDMLSERLRLSVKKSLEYKSAEFANVSQKLDLVSPLGILKRGYAVCKDANGRIAKDSAALKRGENVGVRLAKGSFEAKIEVISNE